MDLNASSIPDGTVFCVEPQWWPKGMSVRPMKMYILTLYSNIIKNALKFL